MMDLILKMLDISDMYGVSKEVDIAKGINKTPMTLSKGWKQRKRRKSWQRKE